VHAVAGVPVLSTPPGIALFFPQKTGDSNSHYGFIASL
jgi:hypothetical protein